MSAEEYTAAEVRQILENLIFGATTGALSLLEETLLKWTRVHPELADEVRNFGRARHGWWPTDPRRNSPEAYAKVITTGARVADLMVAYGDERLPLCGRPSVYGPSCRAVVVDGECTYGPDSHTDKEN